MSKINICARIECPFNKKAGERLSSGCSRYTVSNHCHLITMFPGTVVEANQYWLFVDTDIDLLAIKEANIKYISSSKACQDHLFFEKEFGGLKNDY